MEGRGGAQRRWRTVDSWRSVDLKALGRSGTADKKSAEAREGPRDSKAEYPDAARLAGGIAGLMRRGSQVLDEMLAGQGLTTSSPEFRAGLTRRQGAPKNPLLKKFWAKLVSAYQDELRQARLPLRGEAEHQTHW